MAFSPPMMTKEKGRTLRACPPRCRRTDSAGVSPLFAALQTGVGELSWRRRLTESRHESCQEADDDAGRLEAEHQAGRQRARSICHGYGLAPGGSWIQTIGVVCGHHNGAQRFLKQIC
jgi:hypothetical protein